MAQRRGGTAVYGDYGAEIDRDIAPFWTGDRWSGRYGTQGTQVDTRYDETDYKRGPSRVGLAPVGEDGNVRDAGKYRPYSHIR